MKTQPTLEGQNGTHSYRKTAITVGIVYLLGMVVGIGGNGLVQSILAAPDHLSAVTANTMVLAGGLLLMLLAAVGDAAHGILMFPILKRRGERLAFGYLAFRIVDAAFIGLWVLFLLLQIPLAREYVKAGGADPINLQALSAVSVQASQYAYEIAMMFVGIAGVTLGFVLYTARLVPRFVAVWGLVGYAVHLGGSVLEVLGFGLNLMHVIPAGLWELFIGVWLITKGFSSSPVLSQRPTASATARRGASPEVVSAAT
jgi:hypothetical protein